MERGVVYIYRTYHGVEEALRLDRQYTYREWVGCWSAIKTTTTNNKVDLFVKRQTASDNRNTN